MSPNYYEFSAMFYLCVNVQRQMYAVMFSAVQCRCSVSVPAVHVVEPSMLTLPLPSSSLPLPIGSNRIDDSLTDDHIAAGTVFYLNLTTSPTEDYDYGKCFQWLDESGSTDIIAVKDQMADWRINDGWYTLDGRKLNARPTQKGIYINKGKKVVIM